MLVIDVAMNREWDVFVVPHGKTANVHIIRPSGEQMSLINVPMSRSREVLSANKSESPPLVTGGPKPKNEEK